MPAFEVIAIGFDAESDETDDHVIWVSALSLGLLKDFLYGKPHQYLDPNPLPDDDSVKSCIDFVLPGDEQELTDRLNHFKEMHNA